MGRPPRSPCGRTLTGGGRKAGAATGSFTGGGFRLVVVGLGEEQRKLWKGWLHTSCRLGSGSGCGSGSFSSCGGGNCFAAKKVSFGGAGMVVSWGGAGVGVGLGRLFGGRAGAPTGKEAAGSSTGSATGSCFGRGRGRGLGRGLGRGAGLGRGRGLGRVHSQEWKA